MLRDQAQEAANSEEKSSAGDKYETSRAMNQIERDNYAHQLSVAIEDMNLLQTIDSDRLYEQADNGAVICSTDKSIYFIASGIGIVQFEDDKVIVLSPKAPLAQMLRGRFDRRIRWS
jgi:acyl-CoA thioesterase